MQRKIVSFDPGKTTGVAVFYADFPLGVGEHDLTLEQLGPENHHRALWNLLCDYNPTEVICERFQFRQKLGADYHAPEYIGVIALWCEMFNVPLHMQTPAQAKGFVPNRRLHELHLYEQNKRHSMDALRHLVYYITATLKDPWFLSHS